MKRFNRTVAQALDKLHEAATEKCGRGATVVTYFDRTAKSFEFDISKACANVTPDTTCSATCVNMNVLMTNAETIQSSGSNSAEAIDKLNQNALTTCGRGAATVTLYDFQRGMYAFDITKACTNLK